MTLSFLDRFRPRSIRPDQPPLFDGPAQVRAYWEGLRQGSALPARMSLDPRGLGGVLDRVFLAERIGNGLAQLRIAGSSVATLAGTDPRGLPLSCLFAPESRAVLGETLEQVFAGPAIAEIDLGADRGNVGLIVARLLLLPLQDEAGMQQVLGVIGLFGQMQPCKLQVMSRRLERCVVPAVSPPQPTEPQPRRGSHLRLVAFDQE